MKLIRGVAKVGKIGQAGKYKNKKEGNEKLHSLCMS